MEQTLTKTTFQKYSEYKDSGVDWLGEIPEGWSLLSNKHIFKLKKLISYQFVDNQFHVNLGDKLLALKCVLALKTFLALKN